jgi:hypothetical protein
MGVEGPAQEIAPGERHEHHAEPEVHRGHDRDEAVPHRDVDGGAANAPDGDERSGRHQLRERQAGEQAQPTAHRAQRDQAAAEGAAFPGGQLLWSHRSA